MRPIAFVAILLGAGFGMVPLRLKADEPSPAKGTRAVAVKLAKGQNIPDGVLPGTAIDVVAQTNQPIKTGISLINVKLLAIDMTLGGVPTVTVEVTPTQALVIAMVQKDGITLSVEPHEQQKRER
jgi:Flp pilus assembly protein CpaB